MSKIHKTDVRYYEDLLEKYMSDGITFPLPFLHLANNIKGDAHSCWFVGYYLDGVIIYTREGGRDKPIYAFLSHPKAKLKPNCQDSRSYGNPIPIVIHPDKSIGSIIQLKKAPIDSLEAIKELHKKIEIRCVDIVKKKIEKAKQAIAEENKEHDRKEQDIINNWNG